MISNCRRVQGFTLSCYKVRCVLPLFLLPQAALSQTRKSAIAHNTWTIGAPMPVALDGTAVAVLDKQIYVIGGNNGSGPVADVQIYNPATDTWSMGPALPMATWGGCAAVVKNVLYFIGGDIGQGFTATVWAYSPRTKTWSPMNSSMPTPRTSTVCGAKKGIIYVMGGYNEGFLSTVESYNPATDTWSPDPPNQSMSTPESDAGAGLIGTTIIVTNGSDNQADGNNQGYSIPANTWTWLPSDPTLRQGTCAGSIGPRLYSGGGWIGEENGLTLTESFTLSKGVWKTLAPMPQGTGGQGRSVTYKGKLYCFGGEDSSGNLVGYSEIYQP